jgi:hypothetical protein
MTTFAAPGLEAKVPDPSKHVNYTLGMVLGVDDFNQEFAYTLARMHWLARDALGYGTLIGLCVGWEATGKGPRVTVTSGAALLPRGRLVCVKPAQCGYLNDWLTAHKQEVPALIGSPLSPTLPLYLSLSYRECPVDPVPIPGEPCRTEDELLAPSRWVDDFVLELRATAPDQREEDLLRELIAWLRTLAFGGGGAYADVSAFVAALRASVQEGPQSPLGSPLVPPGVHFLFGSPLASLKLDPALAADYLRAALRIWATEIRPKVRPPCSAGASGCAGAAKNGPPPPDEALLLARVNVPVVNVGGDEWRVDDTRTIAIDESRRPVLASLRLLEEWIPGAGPLPGGAAGARIVAAGMVGPGATGPSVGHPVVVVPPVPPTSVRIRFDGYAVPDDTFQYIVKAMACVGGVANPTIVFDSCVADGIQLRVTNGAAAVPAAQLQAMRFMVEVTLVQA